jgi:hypothetical protein
VLANTPVVKSAPARALFIATAAITAGVLLWTHQLALSLNHGSDLHGLTPIFFNLFAFDDYEASVVAMAIILITVFLSGALPVRRILGWFGGHPLLIAVLTALILSAGTVFIYLNHPLAMDEYAQYFQSQVFAAGKLEGTFPTGPLDWLVPPGFQNFFLSVSPVTGAVASGYWPSFALLLAPFAALGIPWACNPVISALTVLIAHRIALRIYANQEAAGLVVLLTAASPVIFADGISYYSMAAHLLANSIFVLLLLEPTRARVLLAGLVGSVALTLHNPVPHILFAVPWIIWLLRRPGGIALGAWLAAGYAPLCAIIGLGWFWFTGHLRHEGVIAAAVATGATTGSVGGALDGMWQTLSVFSMPDATVFLARFIGIAKIWVWAVPGLMIVAAAGAYRYWRVPAIRLLSLSAILTLLGYFLVSADQGHGWGYRYFHSAWIALPLLAAGALYPIPGAASRGAGFDDEGVRAFVVACAVLTLFLGVGFRAFQMHSFMAADVKQAPAYTGKERRVVMIKTQHTFYAGDLVQNDPWLRGNEIIMMSHDAESDAQMMQQYFPSLHMVYADSHGTVWSAATGTQRLAK